MAKELTKLRWYQVVSTYRAKSTYVIDAVDEERAVELAAALRAWESREAFLDRLELTLESKEVSEICTLPRGR
mgnify:FL=1